MTDLVSNRTSGVITGVVSANRTVNSAVTSPRVANRAVASSDGLFTQASAQKLTARRALNLGRQSLLAAEGQGVTGPSRGRGRVKRVGVPPRRTGADYCQVGNHSSEFSKMVQVGGVSIFQLQDGVMVSAAYGTCLLV